MKVLPQTVVGRVQQFLHVPLGVYLISMRFIKNWHSCAQCVAISIFIIIIPISITISRSAIFMNFPPSYYYLFGPVSCRHKPEIFLLAKKSHGQNCSVSSSKCICIFSISLPLALWFFCCPGVLFISSLIAQLVGLFQGLDKDWRKLRHSQCTYILNTL